MDVTLVFNQMLVLFLAILIGYYALKRGILSQDANKIFSSLIVNITNPAFIISGVVAEERIGSIADVLFVGIIALCMYLILLVIAEFVPKILRIESNKVGLYKAMTVFSNIGFMGFPIISAIFGKGALLYGAIFILPYNILSYTYGIYVITKSSGKQGKFEFKNLLNTGVISCIVAVTIFMLNIKLPVFIVNTVDSIANITTPVSMMVIGMSLANMSFQELFCDLRLYAFSFIKLILLPMMFFFILKSIVKNEIILGTTMIVMSTPVGSMNAMLATQYGGDEQLASKGVLLTTLLSVVTIPVIVMILF